MLLCPRRRPVATSYAALTLLIATTLPALAAEAASDHLQPWQVVMARSITSATVAPDGAQVAYTVSVPRRPLEDGSGPAWVELHVARFADPTGARPEELRPFVTGEVEVSRVAWIANDELAFLAKREGDDHRSLYAISTKGGEARKVLEHDTDITRFSFAPDGRHFVFLAAEAKPAEREELEEKGFDAVVYEEDRPFVRLWSARRADGDAADGDASEPRRLEVEGSLRSVEHAPDGRSLVVTVTPTPLIDDSYVANRVRVLDLEGNVTARIENPGKLGAVHMSPDGDRVALISAADRHDPSAGRLLVADLPGGELRDLLPEIEGDVVDFGWKDRATIQYIATRGTERLVGETLVDGSRIRQLVAAGEAAFTELDSAGGRLALVASAPRHPAELYTLARGALSRVTDSNPWLDDIRLARQEVVEWRASDGLDLQGVLVYPLGYEEGRRYPLILVIHGGPESHYANGWLTGYSQLGQLAAARGFAVFYPNYRGSTGRGVAFSKISQADAAGREFTDYVEAADHLIEIGLADAGRVGITGGSYGGYASAWATTYFSDRFAAAIPFVGISDNISKVGTTDIPYEMYEVHHRKWLWEDWDYFLKRSPIYYAERNRTPTLILHGEDDPRVHPSQSLELHRHLKVLGQAPVRLVLYPGEGHGNRKSAARFDYLLRTLRCFEHYLKGPGGEPPPYEIDYAEHLPWAEEEGESGSSDSEQVAAEDSA